MKQIIYTIFLLFFCGCSKSQFFYHLHGVNLNYYYSPQYGDVTFSDDDFQYSISGISKTGFTSRSTGAFVQFRTTEVEIGVKVGGNYSGHTTQSDCEVLVNGVYNQSVRLTADDVTETHTITLPAGLKTVTLMNGYQIDDAPGSILLPNHGVYIQGVVTDTLFQVVRPVTPHRKWLFVGNSITTGRDATHIAATDFVSMFRAEGRNIQVDAWGVRRILTSTAQLGSDFASFLSDEMNGTISNELFMFLGTNNFAFIGGTGQSKATYKSEYQFFLDSLHSLRPDIIVYCISPLNRTTYSTPNSGGATLDDYSDAIQELLVTRTWAKYIYGKDLLSLSNLSGDGVHPTQVGHQEIHDKLLIAYNLLQ